MTNDLQRTTRSGPTPNEAISRRRPLIMRSRPGQTAAHGRLVPRLSCPGADNLDALRGLGEPAFTPNRLRIESRARLQNASLVAMATNA
jgi:hypothetical protein